MWTEEFDASVASCTTTLSHDSSSDFGSHRFTSSPSIQRRCPTKKKKLRIIFVNFQIIKAKQKAFWAMLEYADPDVILATETWLNPTIAEREVLPKNYRFVARKDRHNSTYGEVAIIAGQEMEASEIDINSTSEFVAAAFNTTSLKKPVVIGYLYRPTDNNRDYCQEMCRAHH